MRGGLLSEWFGRGMEIGGRKEGRKVCYIERGLFVNCWRVVLRQYLFIEDFIED